MEKKKASIGCLFWIALVLLVIVIILFNLKQVSQVLEETGLNKYFKPKTGPTQTIVIIAATPEPGAIQTNLAPETIDLQTKSPLTGIKTDEKKKTIAPIKTPVKTNNPKVSKTDEPDSKTRIANLYFIKLTDDGKPVVTPVKRSVKYVDAPLTATIQALMAGPGLAEKDAGLLNLIPKSSKIKTIYTKGETVFIDFNENFRFNDAGARGLDAQLMQVVFTATEFSNIKNVQILIEGVKVDYLDAEGVYVGKPLSRDSF